MPTVVFKGARLLAKFVLSSMLPATKDSPIVGAKCAVCSQHIHEGQLSGFAAEKSNLMAVDEGVCQHGHRHVAMYGRVDPVHSTCAWVYEDTIGGVQ